MSNCCQKLLIADGNPIGRLMLKKILLPISKIEVVAEAESGDTAFALFESIQPDILVLDIALSGCDSFELIKRAKLIHPEVIIIIVSDEHDEEKLNRVIELGVNGFLLRHTISDCFRQCLEAVNLQQLFVSTSLL